MPLPRWLARFNRRATNSLLRPLVTRLPGWGEVVHTGRRTGREYRTPVIFFRRADRFVVALDYGPDADWVRNVLASGGCRLETQGRVLRLVHPRVVRDERRLAVPPPVRLMLRLTRVNHFLELDQEEGGTDMAGSRGAGSGIAMKTPVAAAISAAFFLVGPGVFVGLVPWLMTGWQMRTPARWWAPLRGLGALLIAAGVGALIQAFVRFVAEGRGTPIPVAAPGCLVVGGPYRRVRNPMYLAGLAAIVGQALLLGQLGLLRVAAAFWLVTAAFVRWYEEPALLRRFGADYDAYRRAVPAWRPRLHPYDPGGDGRELWEMDEPYRKSARSAPGQGGTHATAAGQEGARFRRLGGGRVRRGATVRRRGRTRLPLDPGRGGAMTAAVTNLTAGAIPD